MIRRTSQYRVTPQLLVEANNKTRLFLIDLRIKRTAIKAGRTCVQRCWHSYFGTQSGKATKQEEDGFTGVILTH